MPALQFEPETSQALGFGFVAVSWACYMDVIQNVWSVVNIDLIMTAPSVIYKVNMTDGASIDVSNPKASFQTQPRLIPSRALCQGTDYDGAPGICRCGDGVVSVSAVTLWPWTISTIIVNVIYQIPLAEIVFDFDKLKSPSGCYASFDYEISEYRSSKLGLNGYSP